MAMRSGRLALFSSSSSLIPERNLWDTIYSGTKGLISLLVSEESRQKFMDIVQGSTINADVLKQARFGSMLTIALFHDLQDPLFQKYSFNASDFLAGVQPALTNFHETMGQLQNEFPDSTSKEEQTQLLLERFRQIATTHMTAAPESPWTEQAQNDPHSLAGRLSLMVAPKLFNMLYLTSETESMISKHKEGTTKVSYVALLSARAMVMEEEGFTGTNETPTITTEAGEPVMENKAGKSDKIEDTTLKTKDAEGKETENVVRLESTQADTRDGSTEGGEGAATAKENAKGTDVTPVAAQIEVLYEMNKTVEAKPLLFGQSEENTPTASTAKDETQIWVGTFEGWLNGGPDGILRWKITHLRPPHAEFPGLYHGFGSA